MGHLPRCAVRMVHSNNCEYEHEYEHEYVYTDQIAIHHVSVGLTQAHPISIQSISPNKELPKNTKMAVLAQSEPEAKRPCTTTVTLNPFKGIDSLRERYTEDTADVFFVDEETKEWVPAHREVLKVASAVFFTMFNGDWKEKGETEIQAPEEYKWESFKAAIALLYGEEVEVEESSIPDICSIAHMYDLGGVLSILAQEVCQWDNHLLDTVVELCVLAGDFPERSNSLLNAAIQYIAHQLQKVSPSDIARFSYEAMQVLVQSENITSKELVLLRTLTQWTNAQEDITLRQMKQLYSHIRFGTIPFEGLAECSVIGHDHLKSALQNHQQLMVDHVRSNLVQITPRSGQKEVFQVYPMAQGVRAVVQQNRQIEVANVSSAPAVGVIYCGKQEIRFQVDLRTEARSMQCTLFSLHRHLTYRCSKESALQATLTQRCPLEHTRGVWVNQVNTTLTYRQCTVVLDRTGAHVLLQSAGLPASPNVRATMEMSLPCPDAFPWVLTFGVIDQLLFLRNPNTLSHITIHPPTL